MLIASIYLFVISTFCIPHHFSTYYHIYFISDLFIIEFYSLLIIVLSSTIYCSQISNILSIVIMISISNWYVIVNLNSDSNTISLFIADISMHTVSILTPDLLNFITSIQSWIYHCNLVSYLSAFLGYREFYAFFIS